MLNNSITLENSLLETEAGRAVFDHLIQANVDPRTVSVDTIKNMLLAECRHLRETESMLLHA